MRVLGAVLGWVLVSVQPTKDYTARKQSFTQFLTPQAQQPAGVRRGGKEERRAHDAREDRTREDRVPSPSRAHFDFPSFSTACHAGYKHSKAYRLATSRPHEFQGRICQAAKRPLFWSRSDEGLFRKSTKHSYSNCVGKWRM